MALLCHRSNPAVLSSTQSHFHSARSRKASVNVEQLCSEEGHHPLPPAPPGVLFYLSFLHTGTARS